MADDSSEEGWSATVFSCSYQGLLGATTLVLLTTIDDCVWLIPFLAVPPSRRGEGIVHALVFLTTLVMLSLGLCVVTVIVSTVLLSKTVETQVPSSSDHSTTIENADLILGAIGALWCWAIAAYLIFKRWRKKRKKQQLETAQEALTTSEDDDNVQSAAKERGGGNYGSIPPEDNQQHDTDRRNGKPPKVGMVILLTFLGFLDELVYFPSLILGNIFSVAELSVGIFLAGCVMIAIVTVALAPCQPIIDWIDNHIKLYMVVTMFAILLTIQVIYDLLR
ncbi:hypothetical protein IV203_034220 [Nitzschia inconspicua]|uniref:Uncharacterized protein n=1 Tax=Nitzschia inconspicua TaxID=303405 RepID=A0A9K3Q7F0_9STRA|nr:hypothetical protein IV203_034220 [Nitzschia inconspicua]